MERDACEKTGKLSDFNFNSHAHVERDSGISQRTFCIAISTHTLTWSVTISTGYTAKVQKISTHTLTWSVTSDRYYWNYLWQFQLTRSRGAWHGRKWKNCTWIYISTHTLTWSVTHCSDAVILVNLISTHTLTWSVTNTNVIPDKNKKFQLTRSRGAWREDFNRWCLRCMISTHTLTWSVTSIQIVVINDDTISTHTLTWSVTIFQMYLICCIKFQLTRSRGAWLQACHFASLMTYFNSHAHVERDCQKNLLALQNFHFNSHAHVERDDLQNHVF